MKRSDLLLYWPLSLCSSSPHQTVYFSMPPYLPAQPVTHYTSFPTLPPLSEKPQYIMVKDNQLSDLLVYPYCFNLALQTQCMAVFPRVPMAEMCVHYLPPPPPHQPINLPLSQLEISNFNQQCMCTCNCLRNLQNKSANFSEKLIPSLGMPHTHIIDCTPDNKPCMRKSLHMFTLYM